MNHSDWLTKRLTLTTSDEGHALLKRRAQEMGITQWELSTLLFESLEKPHAEIVQRANLMVERKRRQAEQAAAGKELLRSLTPEEMAAALRAVKQMRDPTE